MYSIHRGDVRAAGEETKPDASKSAGPEEKTGNAEKMPKKRAKRGT